MNLAQQILAAIKQRDFGGATDAVSNALQQKMSQALAQERRSLGEAFLTEAKDGELKVGDLVLYGSDPRTKGFKLTRANVLVVVSIEKNSYGTTLVKTRARDVKGGRVFSYPASEYTKLSPQDLPEAFGDNWSDPKKDNEKVNPGNQLEVECRCGKTYHITAIGLPKAICPKCKKHDLKTVKKDGKVVIAREHCEDPDMDPTDGKSDVYEAVKSGFIVVHQQGKKNSYYTGPDGKRGKWDTDRSKAVVFKSEGEAEKVIDNLYPLVRKDAFVGKNDGLRESVILGDDMPSAEVQRVYSDVRDVAETELLCGIKRLRVNQQGTVVAYVTESHEGPAGGNFGPGSEKRFQTDQGPRVALSVKGQKLGGLTDTEYRVLMGKIGVKLAYGDVQYGDKKGTTNILVPKTHLAQARKALQQYLA